MKTAIVYDRINKWGGAERVLLALHEIFPEAPIYTSFYSEQKALWAKNFPFVVASKVNNIKFFRDKHYLLGGLMPLIFENLNFDKFDLVVSVTSEAAKGIITRGNTKHICYCLTPTRYLWSGYDTYFKAQSFKAISKPVINYLRKWDEIAAQRPDVMIAISSVVRRRIKRYYNRDSEIIHPPLTLNVNSMNRFIELDKGLRKKYFLIVSRLVPYKRVDFAIEAFNKSEANLCIVGVGSEERKLKKMARNNVKFLGQLTDEELGGYYKNAKALIFPQEEDFGLAAVESIASGTPVIAYRAGGALDIIKEKVNGVFFEEQNSESLIEAVLRFEKTKFNDRIVINSAKRFSKENFKKSFIKLI